jgi:hypothetical protein
LWQIEAADARAAKTAKRQGQAGPSDTNPSAGSAAGGTPQGQGTAATAARLTSVPGTSARANLADSSIDRAYLVSQWSANTYAAARHSFAGDLSSASLTVHNTGDSLSLSLPIQAEQLASALQALAAQYQQQDPHNPAFGMVQMLLHEMSSEFQRAQAHGLTAGATADVQSKLSLAQQILTSAQSFLSGPNASDPQSTLNYLQSLLRMGAASGGYNPCLSGDGAFNAGMRTELQQAQTLIDEGQGGNQQLQNLLGDVALRMNCETGAIGAPSPQQISDLAQLINRVTIQSAAEDPHNPLTQLAFELQELLSQPAGSLPNYPGDTQPGVWDTYVRNSALHFAYQAINAADTYLQVGLPPDLVNGNQSDIMNWLQGKLDMMKNARSEFAQFWSLLSPSPAAQTPNVGLLGIDVQTYWQQLHNDSQSGEQTTVLGSTVSSSTNYAPDSQINQQVADLLHREEEALYAAINSQFQPYLPGWCSPSYRMTSIQRTCGVAYSGRGPAFSGSSRPERSAAGKIARPTWPGK